MVALTLVVVVAVTSAAGYAAGRRWLHLEPSRLRAAGAACLECIGLGVLCLLANLALGAAVILAVRAATGRFVSLYVLKDALFAVLSLLQGLVLRWWWERRRP